jgi:hypothetical protein
LGHEGAHHNLVALQVPSQDFKRIVVPGIADALEFDWEMHFIHAHILS